MRRFWYLSFTYTGLYNSTQMSAEVMKLVPLRHEKSFFCEQEIGPRQCHSPLRTESNWKQTTTKVLEVICDNLQALRCVISLEDRDVSSIICEYSPEKWTKHCPLVFDVVTSQLQRCRVSSPKEKIEFSRPIRFQKSQHRSKVVSFTRPIWLADGVEPERNPFKDEKNDFFNFL